MMRLENTAVILLLLLVTLRENIATEITPVAVKMSSVWKLEHLAPVQEFPGSLCIDDHFETKCHTGGSEKWPWIAVEIPLSNVEAVTIINTKDFGFKRTKNLKVWVGDSLPTSTNTEYSQGNLLGTFTGPGTRLQVIHIEKTKGLDGKFVIVQKNETFINLAEIKLYSGKIGPCGSHITRFVSGVMYNGVFNFEKMFCDSDKEKSHGGDDLGYWLAPNKFTGEAFVAELGLKTRIKGVKLRNTHNEGYKDRSTKEFRVSVKETATDPWEVLLTEDLEDSRHQNPPPLQQFEGEKALWGTFIRFELLDYWGEGGGLHYFDIIPA